MIFLQIIKILFNISIFSILIFIKKFNKYFNIYCNICLFYLCVFQLLKFNIINIILMKFNNFFLLYIKILIIIFAWHYSFILYQFLEIKYFIFLILFFFLFSYFVVIYKNNTFLKSKKIFSYIFKCKDIFLRVMLVKIYFFFLYINFDISFCNKKLSEITHNTYMGLGKCIGIEPSITSSILETVGFIAIIGGITYGGYNCYKSFTTVKVEPPKPPVEPPIVKPIVINDVNIDINSINNLAEARSILNLQNIENESLKDRLQFVQQDFVKLSEEHDLLKSKYNFFVEVENRINNIEANVTDIRHIEYACASLGLSKVETESFFGRNKINALDVQDLGSLKKDLYYIVNEYNISKIIPVIHDDCNKAFMPIITYQEACNRGIIRKRKDHDQLMEGYKGFNAQLVRNRDKRIETLVKLKEENVQLYCSPYNIIPKMPKDYICSNKPSSDIIFLIGSICDASFKRVFHGLSVENALNFSVLCIQFIILDVLTPSQVFSMLSALGFEFSEDLVIALNTDLKKVIHIIRSFIKEIGKR